MALAHALRSEAPETWEPVNSQEILCLIGAALTWSRVKGANPEAGPPEEVQRGTLISSWTKVRFGSLLRWAAFALSTRG